MTFAMTSEVDDAHPSYASESELSSAYSAAAHIGESCLDDGPVGRVGLEVEAHCFDLADPLRRPEWAELKDAIAGVPPLPGGSAITVEPGGAVELSGPPMNEPLAAIAAMTADRAVLRSAFAQAGLGLVLLGADPLRPAKRVNPGDRYKAMEEFFIASQTGEAGAAMMTSTASVQINLDAGPRDGWAARVRLAHALGPTMIAIAANSPMLAGRVHRLGLDAAAGVEPVGLGTLRADPRRQRRRPGRRVGALCDEGAGDARAPDAGDGCGPDYRLGAVR